MDINELDKILEESLLSFNEYISINLDIKKISKMKYFVEYSNSISDTINGFVKTDLEKRLSYIKDVEKYNFIKDIITRYYIFYILLLIGYYYEYDMSSYITNILDIGKEQKQTKNGFNNFYDSTNNSILFNIYDSIKKNLNLIKLKNINKIKEILEQNKNTYKSVYDFFYFIGENKYEQIFLNDNENSHTLIYIFIIYTIYIQLDKKDIIRNLNNLSEKNIKYKYIDIITRINGIFDYNNVKNMLKVLKIENNEIDEIYEYILNIMDKQDTIINIDDYTNFLFNTKLFVPITHEFIRYHKSSYNINNVNYINNIGYVLDRINKAKRYYIDTKNVSNILFSQLFPQISILYDVYEDIGLYNKLDRSTNQIEKYEFQNVIWNSYYNFSSLNINSFRLRVNNVLQSIHYHNFEQTRIIIFLLEV